MENLCVVFDLDDTLYKEMDFVRSAYRYISRQVSRQICGKDDDGHARAVYDFMWGVFRSGGLSFESANEKYGLDIPVSQYLHWYRTHPIEIELREDAAGLISRLAEHEVPIGIITDGRSLTQRNKINSLGLDRYVKPEDVVVSEEIGSEKPNPRNYEHFMQRYSGRRYIYVGDNPKKDFIAPNALGWQTFGIIGDEENIHPPKGTFPPEAEPSKWLKSHRELIPILGL